MRIVNIIVFPRLVPARAVPLTIVNGPIGEMEKKEGKRNKHIPSLYQLMAVSGRGDTGLARASGIPPLRTRRLP
jgi:hypothetical protein